MLQEDLNEKRRKQNSPPAGYRFRFVLFEALPDDAPDRAAYLEKLLLKVDIAPTECEQLPSLIPVTSAVFKSASNR